MTGHVIVRARRTFHRYFSNKFCWHKGFVFWLELYCSLFLRVQLTINQYWFGLWLIASLVKNHYLNQCWPSSMMMWIKQDTIFHGAFFRFNLWDHVHWIREYWLLDICTVMYCLWDQFNSWGRVMHRRTMSTLVQIMACRLDGNKPLPEPILIPIRSQGTYFNESLFQIQIY